MNAQGTVNQYLALQQIGLSVANRYTDIARKTVSESDLSKDEVAKDLIPCKTFTKFYEAYKEGFFSVSYEYNDSCNCHPEYRDWELQFPLFWLDLNDSELEKTITNHVQNLLDERRKTLNKDVAEAEAKKLLEERRKEESERKQLAKLKEKYER